MYITKCYIHIYVYKMCDENKNTYNKIFLKKKRLKKEGLVLWTRTNTKNQTGPYQFNYKKGIWQKVNKQIIGENQATGSGIEQMQSGVSMQS